MSSIAASMSVANHALYAASKSANEGLCRSFAADGGPKRITCNCIAPGGIKTEMFEQNAWHYAPGGTPDTPISQIEAGISKLVPLGRVAIPADIANVVMFLCHNDSEWINGMCHFPKPWRKMANVSNRSDHSLDRWCCECLEALENPRLCVRETLSKPLRTKAFIDSGVQSQQAACWDNIYGCSSDKLKHKYSFGSEKHSR